MTDFVAYVRVSTAEQGRSGLGMQAQLTACQEHVDRAGGHLVDVFKDVMSGARDRPGLDAALQCSVETGAQLIVAKLDRLSRDAETVLRLVNSGAGLVFLDIPGADTSTPAGKLFVSVMAALAEFERGRISERIKGALAAIPEDDLRHPGRRAQADARLTWEPVRPHLEEILEDHPRASLRVLQRRLENRGHAMSLGKVSRVKQWVAEGAPL